MKTTVEYKDGHVKVYEESMPSCYMDELSLLDTSAGVDDDEIPLDSVKRIVFENDGD